MLMVSSHESAKNWYSRSFVKKKNLIADNGYAYLLLTLTKHKNTAQTIHLLITTKTQKLVLKMYAKAISKMSTFSVPKTHNAFKLL